MKRLHLCLLLFLVLLGPVALAQQADAPPSQKESSINVGKKGNKIIIDYADSLVGVEVNGVEVQKLMGNVQVHQDSTYMYCDSAYVYKGNKRLDAFNNVRVNQGDTLLLSGDTLFYDASIELAKLRGDITLEDPEMTLTTKYLDYNLGQHVGYYRKGGTLVSKKEKNTLVSRQGYYYPDDKTFFFKKDVVLTHPDYIIESDTLKYNTATEVTYFFGPTTITSAKDSNVIYCEAGYYDTRNNISEFRQHARIITTDYQLEGDSLVYDRENGIGQVFGHVILLDTAQAFMIRGDSAVHYEQDSMSVVTGRAELVQFYDGDSLFLHGDTLMATYDSTRENRLLLAYDHVKFFKSDFQGRCDSLAYTLADSLFELFHDPVLWSDANQITSDSIRLVQGKEGMEAMYMDRNAFIISEDDTGQYNQIKGKNMVGSFQENKLRLVNVHGNGQTIYYAREEDNTLLGVNKAVCSNIRILIDSNKIEDIFFLKSPDATLTPLKLSNPADLTLQDFNWRGAQRPTERADIFVWDAAEPTAATLPEEQTGDEEEPVSEEETESEPSSPIKKEEEPVPDAAPVKAP